MTDIILATTVLIALALGFAIFRPRRQPALQTVKSYGWLRRFDDSGLADLERTLLSADMGVKTTHQLLEKVSGIGDPSQIKGALKREIRGILNPSSPLTPLPVGEGNRKPYVIMFVGVNGVGKTTSIGKVAQRLKNEGKSVLLGAGDTFRAAAADQLAIWAQRSGVPIVTGKHEADPSSVLFDAVQKGKQDGVDVVLCDTAGRLHTKMNLMDELKKVHRVIGKACPGAPHEVWLVLDATTGQNAIVQAKQFSEATPLTGIILNKLDGTAKGGVVIGIMSELGIPIKFVGVGEGINDLKPFDADAFVDAMF